jgi:hypothetical protein
VVAYRSPSRSTTSIGTESEAIRAEKRKRACEG